MSGLIKLLKRSNAQSLDISWLLVFVSAGLVHHQLRSRCHPLDKQCNERMDCKSFIISMDRQTARDGQHHTVKASVSNTSVRHTSLFSNHFVPSISLVISWMI